MLTGAPRRVRCSAWLGRWLRTREDSAAQLRTNLRALPWRIVHAMTFGVLHGVIGLPPERKPDRNKSRALGTCGTPPPPPETCRRDNESCCQSAAQPQGTRQPAHHQGAEETQQGLDMGLTYVERPNDPSSATRPTRALDCNRGARAGFAAAHG